MSVVESSGVSALRTLIDQIDDTLAGKAPTPELAPKLPELVMPGAIVIYRLTSPEGKCYVGLTTRTLAERYHEHLHNWLDAHGHNWPYKYEQNSKLYEAFERLPPYLWKQDVLYRTHNIDAASFLEKVFIRHNRAQSNGYNIKAGGLSLTATERIKQRRDVNVKESQQSVWDDAAIYHASDIGRILTPRQLRWYRKNLLLRS